MKESKEIAIELIPCPDCGNDDTNAEHEGFTFPFQGDASFCVCQNCGRRRWLDEWNDLDSKEAPLDEAEVIEAYKGRDNKDVQVSRRHLLADHGDMNVGGARFEKGDVFRQEYL